MTLNFDLHFIHSRHLSGPSGATVLGILNNVYNQIKINKNGNDCKLVAENVRKIEISIWRRVTARWEGEEGRTDAGGLCIKVSAQIDVSWHGEVFQLAKGVRRSGGGMSKVDC